MPSAHTSFPRLACPGIYDMRIPSAQVAREWQAWTDTPVATPTPETRTRIIWTNGGLAWQHWEAYYCRPESIGLSVIEVIVVAALTMGSPMEMSKLHAELSPRKSRRVY